MYPQLNYPSTSILLFPLSLSKVLQRVEHTVRLSHETNLMFKALACLQPAYLRSHAVFIKGNISEKSDHAAKLKIRFLRWLSGAVTIL
jgi:hypothetical protein